MTSWRDDDLDDDELDDRDMPDDSDVDDDADSIETSTCPKCGNVIYHDVAVCARCGHFISDTQPTYRKPLWIICGVALCLLIVVLLWLK